MTGRDNALWIALESAGIRLVLARSEAAAVIDAVIDREAIAPVTRYDKFREREL